MSDKHTLVFEPGALSSIRADRERIEQVLNNLVSNAIKYSPNGGKVMIASAATGEDVAVSVSDVGIGIPEEALTKVFDRSLSRYHGRDRSVPWNGIRLIHKRRHTPSAWRHNNGKSNLGKRIRIHIYTSPFGTGIMIMYALPESNTRSSSRAPAHFA